MIIFRIISPLKYCGDYRPYFTIHDSEFKQFTSKAQGPPPVVLGVTNPFFAKILHHWPHTIRLGPDLGIIFFFNDWVFKFLYITRTNTEI